MENEPQSSLSMDEFFQNAADDIRPLQMGLRNHDPETVEIAMQRLAERWGEEIAIEITCGTITRMMIEEGWSFEMENGESSPLL